MKRWITAVALGLVMLLSIPASAAEPVCGNLFGVARLNASGAGTATGGAVVFFNGSVQRVAIDSAINGSVVNQTWNFREGAVEVTETPRPRPLPGPRQSINSTVIVDGPPDSGTWRYRGVFNERTLTARFVVTGYLCIGGST